MPAEVVSAATLRLKLLSPRDLLQPSAGLVAARDLQPHSLTDNLGIVARDILGPTGQEL